MANCSGTRRRGVVYGVDLIDHATGQIRRCDYVGQTRQLLRTRGNQHRDVQPWSDLIVGEFYVIAEGWWTDAELDALEELLILERRPRMNWLLNESNPEQIPKWVQREQRWARDDAARVSRWVPPDDRTAAVPGSTPVMPDRRVSTTRRWSPWQVKLCLWCLAWLLLTIVGWGVLARHGRWSTLTDALSASAISAVLLLWAVLRRPDSWRLWRRRFRKLRRGPR